jgi:hypothetical protein
MIGFSGVLKGVIVAIVLVLSNGFSMFGPRSSSRTLGSLLMTKEEPSSFRESQMQKVKDIGSSALKVMLGASVLLPSQPAFAAKLSDCNEVLTRYGLPPILFVPPGFSPLVSEFGRGNIKEGLADNPILVQFAHPGLWVEAKTSVNNNGEAGTISANDYIKGDSAFLYTYPLDGSEGKVNVDNKQLINKIVLKGITQKGDVTEEFKVKNYREGPKGVNGQEYVIADIFYKLNTEAGFLVSRQGFIAITSVGKYAQSLTAVSTDKRYNKGMKEKLSDIVESFRVYKLQSGVFTKPEHS